MRRIILLITLLSLTNSKNLYSVCSNKEFNLSTPEFDKFSPIFDQGPLNICAYYTASYLLNYNLYKMNKKFKKPALPQNSFSPFEVAIKTKERITCRNYGDEGLYSSSTLGIGLIDTAYNNAITSEKFCSQNAINSAIIDFKNRLCESSQDKKECLKIDNKYVSYTLDRAFQEFGCQDFDDQKAKIEAEKNELQDRYYTTKLDELASACSTRMSNAMTSIEIEDLLNISRITSSFKTSEESKELLLGAKNAPDLFKKVFTNYCKEENLLENILPKNKISRIDLSSDLVFNKERIENILCSNDNPRPIGIDFCVEILKQNTKFEEGTDKCFIHSSVITGRRVVNGKTQFLIRNSWGTSCYGYGEFINPKKNCKGGYIWLDEEYLLKNSIRMTSTD